jgi:ABC-type dipeptide/oligopeptide/nickel transport system permease subunit
MKNEQREIVFWILIAILLLVISFIIGVCLGYNQGVTDAPMIAYCSNISNMCL